MTLMLDLDPQLEDRLRAEAAKTGLDASQYALHLIKQNLPAPETARQSLWYTLTPEEWLHAFDEWSNSHDRSIPPLSDEAVSRESFYEGRP